MFKKVMVSEIPIHITPDAQKELETLFIQGKVPEGLSLRIAAKGSGCSGIQHILGFDKKTNNDLVYPMGAFEILIEKKHMIYLIGLKLDYIENNLERGFQFSS